MKTKTTAYEKQFKPFAEQFGALCLAHGGAYSERDAIGKGASYTIPTAFGTLLASIHYDDWPASKHHRRSPQHPREKPETCNP